MIKRFGKIILSMVVCISLFGALTGCSSETYTPKSKTPLVMTPVIMKEGVLTVGVNADSSPYSKQGTSGIVGINVDIAAAIADDLGLKLELVDIGTDPAKALSDGTVDIVMGVEGASNASAFWRSDPYIQSAPALFSATPGATIPTDPSVRIAAQTSAMSAWEVNKQFGEGALVASNDLKTAFDDLKSGTVQYVAADAVIGTFAANQNGVDASIVALLQQPSGQMIGVADENTDLKQIISDTLVKLSSNGVLSLVETKFLGTVLAVDTIPLSPTASIDDSETEEPTEPEGEAGDTDDSTVPDATTPESGTDAGVGTGAGTDESELEAGGNAVQQPGADSTLN